MFGVIRGQHHWGVQAETLFCGHAVQIELEASAHPRSQDFGLDRHRVVVRPTLGQKVIRTFLNDDTQQGKKRCQEPFPGFSDA